MTEYITGDTHRGFRRIYNFCQENETTREDLLIILGDAGINFYGEVYDRDFKEKLSAALPITLLCVHGNHEKRPESVTGYRETEWHGGIVYVEDAYPNFLFAKDGECYQIAGKSVFVIGGAYSVDKYFRISRGLEWFEDEQPSEKIKKRVEAKLEALNWKVDVVLTHTTPYDDMPTEAFLKGIDQSRVDNSTEMWLQSVVKERLTYERWYAGHFHVEKLISESKMEIMFENVHAF